MNPLIWEGLTVLLEPGHVHELRIMEGGRQGTISGYYNDWERLASDAETLDGHYPGIYFTPNPCKPALLARANNRYRERVKNTTSDGEIVQRRWMLFDFDPTRPAGISSTNDELGRAIAVATGTWDELRTFGFGDPVVAHSGNGAHLLYRFTAPNTPEITDFVRSLLHTVAARCATEDVKVDLSVFNAARIWKLYGTLACKGDSTKDRPHRRSRILEVPSKIGQISLPERLAA